MSKKTIHCIIYAIAVLTIHFVMIFNVPRSTITIPFSLLFALLFFGVTFVSMHLGYPKPRTKGYWIEMISSYPFFFCTTYFLLRI